MALDEQFNAPDAEFILRSSDGVDFAAHKLILQLASHVFRDMLSLPQPSTSTEASSRAIIDMTEDAQSLRYLLRYNYPRAFCPEPELSTLGQIKLAAALAHKYGIESMRDAAEKALIHLANYQPDVAYAVAWRYEYPKALRAAARRCLEPFVAAGFDAVEFDEIPASALRRLEQYKDASSTSVMDLLSATIDSPQYAISCIEFNGLWHDFDSTIMPECSCDKVVVWQGPSLFYEDSLSKRGPMPMWWWTYIEAIVTAVSQRSLSLSTLNSTLHKPFRHAHEKAMGCPYCRRFYVPGLLDVTKQYLRNEIERRFRRVPIDAPFMNHND
ncbi:hypothetical protein PENSPDRAFT_691802 [Peniophora sp. CONT]|nr:hypothetical protein PENSPDRAFT_691802 [Peniophora sp. CONT]